MSSHSDFLATNVKFCLLFHIHVPEATCSSSYKTFCEVCIPLNVRTDILKSRVGQ